MIRINKAKLKCPQCGAPMKEAISISGKPSKNWMVCTRFPNCKTFIDTYVPLPFQNVIHKDPHRDLGIFGGYGSGKTTVAMKDDEKHILSTPQGETAVGSAVLAQVEATYEKEFRQDLPKDFVYYENKSKKYYIFQNGHTLFIKSFYEPNVLRSLNLSRYHIVEASEVTYSIKVELTARLRNLASVIPETDEDGNFIYDPETDSFKVKVDWRKGISESNPDPGWIRSDFLLNSGTINIYGDLNTNFHITSPNPNYSSHIIPTKANKYLPPSFYQDNARNKPLWWILRYLEASFEYSEGMVYPRIMATFCKSFPIPYHWKRLIGADYGIRDDTSILFGAIDPLNKKIYIYKEIRINDVNYKVISKLYKDFCSVPSNVPAGSLYRSPVMDARSLSKRNDKDLKTIGELFAEEGVYFEPAQMNMDARILKVNTFVESDSLRIFEDMCPGLVAELKEYKFPDLTLGKSMTETDQKPKDKFNHGVNALEFLIMEAPYDLSKTELDAYDGSGNKIEAFEKQTQKQLSRFNTYVPFSLNVTPISNLEDGEAFDNNQGGFSW
jgi:ssDNA-binding Zn-finger/Zn-ribbon topoisomerase 1